MFSFETQHPTHGYDVVVTAEEDGNIQRVTDGDKLEISLSPAEMEIVRQEAIQYENQ